MEDATGTLLNMILKYLEGTKAFATLLSIGFSSAFNCIQPHVPAEKLNGFYGIGSGLTGGRMDFLSERSQRVRVSGDFLMSSSTGSPGLCSFTALIHFLHERLLQPVSTASYFKRHLVPPQ